MVKPYLHSIILLSVIFAFSCNSASKKNQLPELFQCDSATVMYYDTPGNPRFFKMSKLYSAPILEKIAINANATIRNKQDTCLSTGKIYLYGDKGEVYVLYFSTKENCRVLRFIKTGEKFEVALAVNVSKILDSLQGHAYEPKPSKSSN
jgi:hypothetical protein